MRTVTFKSVYDAILQRIGLDPVGDATNYDTSRAITEHLTDRVGSALQMWDWPQLTITEQRAYRAPWYPTIAYKPGDEVYYVLDEKYYKVLPGANPPPGVPPPTPAATSEWALLDPVTTFVSRDQIGKPPLGKVIGAYKSDPSLNGCCPHDICLKFRPTEQGTYLCYAPATTVFLCYIPPAPAYTMVPWIASRAYAPGERVFYHVTGECYLCVATTTIQPPVDALFWVKIPVPELFAPYAKAGVAADCLREISSPEDQIRLTRAAALEAEATGNIQAEIDDLLAQGQKHFYIKPYWCDGWCLSEPWVGSTVVPLTGAFISPSPPVTGALPVGIYYYGTVASLKTITPTLCAIATTTDKPVNSMAIIKTGQHFRLDAGVGNTVADPGEGQPFDYNATTNNKHWVEVL